MQQISIIQKLKTLISILSNFAGRHQQSLSAMQHTYRCCSAQSSNTVESSVSTLTIAPYGSLFKVTEVLESNGTVSIKTHLASYGWHSNGHLIEIGEARYWIFDPLHQQLYVEDYDEELNRRAQCYHKI